jgi:RNA polymerase sigma-70 factor, ECF subfamily
MPPSTRADPHGDVAAWLAPLRDGAPDAQRRLHELLLRAARAEVARRAAARRVTGPELDDLAHQAAADAMVAVLDRLATFRGESRFTTWAYKFVMFEVSGKLARHFWSREPDRADEPMWDRLPDRFGFGPEQAAQAGDLLGAVRHAVEHELSDRQRDAFVAVVVDGVPLDVLVERWGSNRNAIYQAVFGARRKIRIYLVTNGYLDEDGNR